MAQKRQDHTNMKRFFASPLFVICGILLAGLLVFRFGATYLEEYRIKQEIASYEDQIKDLEKKKLESLDILEYVMGDDFVEEKARTELNLLKPGEQVIVIQSSTDERRRMEIAGIGQEEGKKSNPAEWWGYFTGKERPQFERGV